MHPRLKAPSTHLPEKFHAAFELCFAAHDVIAQLLVSGMEAGLFVKNIKFQNHEDKASFEEADDIFEWFKSSGRLEDKVDVLVSLVFPAVLSDMLHCIFEALETSRKGKLAISYMLLRKPLQESLYLLESVIANKEDFAEKLSIDPLKLRPQNAGGIPGHTKRIQKVLEIIGEQDKFDAEYLAKLRYDKLEQDSFDGICNKAMHLFTDHHALRTEPHNVNFIFSGEEEIEGQWSFLYSRLPYILIYVASLSDYISLRYAETLPLYIDDVKRRLTALSLISTSSTDAEYITEQWKTLIATNYHWLLGHCDENGYRAPEPNDLIKMGSTGAFPGETNKSVKARARIYDKISDVNKTRS